ncbi:hypothetical protein DPMN_175788 [Dreissena polymorpha]|uniref:Uncharacterized protein n=1 Tax=Dreissena polymorpha TaxID=45954 RepID=A0A9D4E759_DREPO|nr:hypothetical protein DPMN_175788 [Dreissena polymorpha]
MPGNVAGDVELKLLVKNMWESSVSGNTLKVYNTGMDSYKQFLRRQAVVYAGGSPPPVTNDSLIHFIAYCHHCLKLKYQTYIELYLSGSGFLLYQKWKRFTFRIKINKHQGIQIP